MYTVLRFDLSDSSVTLEEFGQRFTDLTGHSFDGADKGVPDRVSVTAASDSVWFEHLASIERYLSRHGRLIQWAREGGVSLEIDIAIEPSDISGLLASFCVPCNLLRTLGENRIGLEFSVYK